MQWKPDLLEAPIFRHQVKDDISNSIPWTFKDLNWSMKRLGLLSGYPQDLTSYVLHSVAANAIDCTFSDRTIPLANSIQAHK